MDFEKFATIVKNSDGEKVWEIIKTLYLQNYTYKLLTSLFQKIYNDFTIQDIISVLQYYDIKKCSAGDKCKSFNGAFQSRKSFVNNSNYPDGLNPTCRECKSYYSVYKRANQKKKNRIDYFRSLKTVEEREDYIYDLYVNQNYTIRDIKSITLFTFEYVSDLIINKFGIQRCLNGHNCVNPNGPLLDINNFGRDNYRSIGFSTICKTCVQKKCKSDNSKLSHKKSLEKFATFDIFAAKVNFADYVRRDPDNSDLMQVQCYNHKCNKWFNPTVAQVQYRYAALIGRGRSVSTACNFYCSQNCKNVCPVFGVKARELISVNTNDKEYQRIQSEVRKFKINIEGEPDCCEICGIIANVSDLILHHKYPVAIDHILEADLDNLIWVCIDCHKKAHQKDGCGYYELTEMRSAC